TDPTQHTICIQPDEGSCLNAGAKAPGPRMFIRKMQMNFSYSTDFGEFPATAYETLLLDSMLGDTTLFNRNDAVALSWQILEPVLDAWHATRGSAPFPNYPAGSWSPMEADAVLAHDPRDRKNATTLPPITLEQDKWQR